MNLLLGFAAIFHAAWQSGTFLYPITNSADFLVVPLHPALYETEYRCEPNNPQTVRQWRNLSNADMALNGGFFDISYWPMGFAKTAEKTYGNTKSHPAFFAIDEDGEAKIVLREEAPESDKYYILAVSGFPVLVSNGENRFLEDSFKYDRRTVIAQKDELLYLFVSWRGAPSLAETAAALRLFGIDTALNLDGGTGTGFSSEAVEVPSVKVPCVLLFFFE
jgi:hypothetical protein